MNKIKDFLGDNSVEAVRNNPELAGKLLAESLFWEMEKVGDSIRVKPTSDSEFYVEAFSQNLNLIDKAQDIAMYKADYYQILTDVVKDYRNDYPDFRLQLISANAEMRLVACLLAMSEVE